MVENHYIVSQLLYLVAIGLERFKAMDLDIWQRRQRTFDEQALRTEEQNPQRLVTRKHGVGPIVCRKIVLHVDVCLGPTGIAAGERYNQGIGPISGNDDLALEQSPSFERDAHWHRHR